MLLDEYHNRLISDRLIYRNVKQRRCERCKHKDNSSHGVSSKMSGQGGTFRRLHIRMHSVFFFHCEIFIGWEKHQNQWENVKGSRFSFNLYSPICSSNAKNSGNWWYDCKQTRKQRWPSLEKNPCVWSCHHSLITHLKLGFLLLKMGKDALTLPDGAGCPSGRLGRVVANFKHVFAKD